MKKVFILTSFAILIILLPWVAIADDLKEAQKHVRNLDAAVNATLDRVEGLESNTKKHITNLDTAVNALAGRVEEIEQKQPAVVDNQARQIGNRALAWSVRLSVIDKDGKYPDIEEVERVLTPIEKGNMSPKAFETAIWEAVKAKGWTYLNKPPTGLCEQDAKKIAKDEAEKASGDALVKAKAYTDEKSKATAESLNKIEEGIASLKTSLDGVNDFKTQLAKKADQGALDSFRNQVLDEKGEPKFVLAKEFTELKDQVIDENGKLKVAKNETVEAIFISLDERAKRTESRVSALEAATTYLSQKKWDEAKGAMFIHYGRDGLRALGWSEKEIDKAEKAAGKMRQPQPSQTEAPQPEEATY